MRTKRSEDIDIIASRALEPKWFEAPYPEWSGVVPSPYQHAAVEYAICRKHCLIGDAPGLGKSAESLLFGNSIGAKYTLIICPASLRLNWEREVKMWSCIEGATTYPVLASKDGVSLKHNYVIISYSLLRNKGIQDALLEYRWDHVILDEAHALKDPMGNQRTRVICAPDMLPSVADRFTLLSGTILPNQPLECYNAMRLMNWDSLDRMSLEEFQEEYYEKGGGWVRDISTITGADGKSRTREKLRYSLEVRNVPVNMEDLQWRLRKHVMVRRLKEEVLTQLPPKQWHPFPLETNAAIRKLLKRPEWIQVEKLHEMNVDAFDLEAPIAGEVSTVLRQLGEAKAPLVADYIEELLSQGVHKILVGCWHVNTREGEGVKGKGLSVFDYLRSRLKKYGLVFMHGQLGTHAKQRAVDTFQNDPECRIILGQLASIGEGWTLTEAQDAVFAEFYWVPGKNDQLLDRLHRRGQQGGYVLGHVPIVPGSIDERVIGTAVQKGRNIYKALDAPI